MNKYVESVAILLVTSCILPCLGLVFILWLIKMFFGFDVLSRVKGTKASDRPGPVQERKP